MKSFPIPHARYPISLLFIALLSAGALRAADDIAALDDALTQLKTFDYGQDAKPLRAVEKLIGMAPVAAKPAIADKLVALASDAQVPEAARLFSCQQLHKFGSDAQVEKLAKMLDDPKTAEIARYALEGIGSEKAREALRTYLFKAQAEFPNKSITALVGVVNSLGALRDEKSQETLALFVTSRDAKLCVAAAKALARIGNAASAEALSKAKAPVGSELELADAQLACAERIAGPDLPAAAKIYDKLWATENPVQIRIAALRGLAKTRKEAALPMVLDALGGTNAELQSAALSALAEIPGPAATNAMVGQATKLTGPALVSLIDALGQRGDKSARDAVAPLLASEDSNLRAAAAGAMGKLGDASSIELLAKLASGQDAAARAAQTSLARLSGQGIDAALIAAIDKSSGAPKAALIRAGTDRRTPDFSPVLLKAVDDADDPVRAAAVDAMSQLGGAECYPKLIDMLLASPAEGIEKATLAVAARLPDDAARLKPVLSALEKSKAEPKAAFLRVLRGLSGADALKVVKSALADADPIVREAAVRALADWQDESPATDVLALIKDAPEPKLRILALRGYMRMARTTKAGPAQQLSMLQQVAKILDTSDARKMLLAGLADIPEAGALQVASTYLAEDSVKAEANIACNKIGGALLKANAAAGREAIEKIAAASPKPVADALAAILEASNKPQVEGSAALSHNDARSEEIKKSLAKRAPKDFRLACYLDCGPDKIDGAKDGPKLSVADATPWFWPDSDQKAHFRYGSVWYHGGDLQFDAAGLNPKKAYQLGFSWWDFDGNGRAQSVWASTGKGEKRTQLIKSTPLPDGQSPPAEITASIPATAYADGTLRITFHQEGQSNVVCSEIWLWEGAEGVVPASAPAEVAPASVPAVAQPVTGMKAGTEAGATKTGDIKMVRGKQEPGRTTKVLIVTGIDYPGHLWQKTAPVLAEELTKDKRLLVDTAEDPDILSSKEINDYDVLVIHFMNWQKPAPGDKARENLKAFVEGGKGLVYVHFACGAFQDGGNPWPDFIKIAGKVWDRKLRGHDPHGTFQVRATDVKHPITEGLQPFDTTDELYTCLAGDVPVTTIAVATSKVDKKDYAMGFVFDVGKGRVFHSPLGHDVKAYAGGAGELFRRGTAWAAGISPVAK
ncbi:MAG TPA: HEAT repeat domain-containing protein [Planctomycetota bacterium]|jgi:type 1 glutamine amidotransferase/HEAT repeat protein